MPPCTRSHVSSSSLRKISSVLSQSLRSSWTSCCIFWHMSSSTRISEFSLSSRVFCSTWSESCTLLSSSFSFNDGILLGLTGSALHVNALAQPVDFILDVSGHPLLSLLAELLLLGELDVEGEALLIHLLHHLCLKLLASLLLVSNHVCEAVQ